jgi:hypothetical protein
MIEIEDTSGLGGEGGITWEDPTAMTPWPQRILAKPAPQRGAADLGDEPLRHRLAPQFGASPARQRQTETDGQLTSQRLDLDHDAGGKSAAVARRAAARRGRLIARERNAAATCSRSGAACRGGQR